MNKLEKGCYMKRKFKNVFTHTILFALVSSSVVLADISDVVGQVADRIIANCLELESQNEVESCFATEVRTQSSGDIMCQGMPITDNEAVQRVNHAINFLVSILRNTNQSCRVCPHWSDTTDIDVNSTSFQACMTCTKAEIIRLMCV